MKRILLLILSTKALISAPGDAAYKAIKRANHRANSKVIRNTATETDARQALAAQPTNGDHSAIDSIPAPPAVASAEKAGEMVEVYWMALLRDVPFTAYNTDATVAMAVTDLNNLSDFKGQPVTPQNLFRIDFPGIQAGPYISQLLYQQVLFS